MHILVTGATGFVGFHTVKALIDAGHTVRLGIRSVEKMRRVYEPHGIDISNHSVGEITDADSVNRALDGCDGVVHTAAIVDLDARNADYVRDTNFRGTELVIGGAAEREMKSIVYVSSVTALFNPELQVITEDSPLGNSENGYGRSKVDSERFVQTLQAKGTPIAISYPATILGPHDPGMSEGSQGMQLFFNATGISTSSGIQIIDVRDLANAHVGLLEQSKSGRYLVAGHYVSWDEYGELLNEITGKKLIRVPVPAPLLKGIGSSMDFLMRYMRFETNITREAVTYATSWVPADDSKIRTELKLEYRDLRETLRDATIWLAEAGHIDKKWVKNMPVA